ncbi:MAG: M3 family metallopeptidase [Elusimicrobia bacterium]|nr:M3 family metallopeptidase [Elusimicrobiota bacterium]
MADELALPIHARLWDAVQELTLDYGAAAGRSTARRDAYLKMLSSGSSKEPIELLRDAGVDMTTSAPFKAAMKEMNETMDEMEKLL